MTGSSVIITAQGDQAVREFERVRVAGTDALQDVANAGARVTPTLDRVGTSSRQMAAAMRMVPAQVTDIITSLQGGQAPLTVFLQQGGQLRDMFGSSGAAARALGQYLVGMITPMTVGAAAAAGLAVAWYQGSHEALGYARAIAASGNAAGTTSDQLANMARNMSGSIGTQRDAAAALTALVDTGKVSADNLQRIGTVALKMQEALGKSIGDTAEEFASLARTPVTSLEKLNDKYHFLTGSVYEHVRSLQEQGRTYEAGVVAQQAYATAMDDMSTKVTASLGSLQRGWNGVKDFAKGAWDAMLDVGREDTLEQKLAKVQEQIKKAQTPGLRGFDARSDLQQNLELEASLKGQITKRDHIAAIQADQARFNEADTEWSKSKFQYLTRQKQLENELSSAKALGIAAGISDEDINKRLIAIRQKYSDIYNDGVNSQIEALKRRANVEDALAQRSLAQVAANHAAGIVNEEDYINQVAQLELKGFDRSRTLLTQELELTKKKQNSLKDQQDLLGQIAMVDEQRKTRAQKQEQDLFALEQKRTRLAMENFANAVAGADAERDNLVKQYQAQVDYNEQIGLTKVQLGNLTAARLLDMAARKDSDADIAEGLDLSGRLAEAYRQQAEALRNRAVAVQEGAVKEQRYDEWKKAVDDYSQVFRDGFVGMLNNGLGEWKAFGRSLLTTFKTSVADQIFKMFAKPLVVKMVGSFLGMDQSAIASQVAGGTMSTASGAGTSAAGSSIGSMAGSLFGAGGLSGSLVAGAGWMTGATTLGGSLAAGASLIGTGTLAGAMSGIGMLAGALGPIALGIGAVVALANALDHSGTPHIGGAASASSAGVSTIRAEDLHFEKTQISADAEKMTAGLASGIVGILDSTALAFGKTAGYTAATAFADDSSKDGAWGGLVISKLGKTLIDWQDARGNGPWAPKVFADGAEGQKQYLAAISADVRTALNGIGLPAWAQKMLDGLGNAPAIEDLAKVVDNINVTQRALKAMGDQLVGFSSLSESAVSALMAATGGIQNLAASASAYYDNFYSDAEKAASATKQVGDALKAVGLEMPSTRDQYRAQLEAQMKLGETGAPAVAALLGNAAAFAQLHPAVESATSSIEAARSALTDAYQAETDALKATNDRMSTFTTNLRNLRDNALLGNLSPLTPQQKYLEAKAQFDRILTSARAGDENAQSQYQNAYNAFLTASQTVNASGAQYQRDFAYAQAATEEAIQWAQKQVDVSQASLDALNKQVEGLLDVKNAVMTVSEAINALAATMGGASSGTVSGSQKSALESLYQSMLGRAPDAAGLQFWQQSMAGGTSISEIASLFTQSTEYQQKHSSSYIAPMASGIDYSAMGSSNTVSLVAEIKALRDSNQALQQEVRGLRTDADRQTGDLMAANADASANSAQTIAEAATRAVAAAAQARETRVMPA